MKSKQPTSKREFRDGGSSKKPAAQKTAAPKAAAPKTQNKRSDGLKAGKNTQTACAHRGKQIKKWSPINRNDTLLNGEPTLEEIASDHLASPPDRISSPADLTI